MPHPTQNVSMGMDQFPRLETHLKLNQHAIALIINMCTTHDNLCHDP